MAKNETKYQEYRLNAARLARLLAIIDQAQSGTLQADYIELGGGQRLKVRVNESAQITVELSK